MMRTDLKAGSQGRHFLRRSDAATYVTERYACPCSRQWVAKLAVIGGGPVFRKAGRYPVYEPSELDQWAKAHIGPPQRSTSDEAGPGGYRRATPEIEAPTEDELDVRLTAGVPPPLTHPPQKTGTAFPLAKDPPLPPPPPEPGHRTPAQPPTTPPPPAAQ